MTTSSILNNRAETGFQDGSHYDKYRPSYPTEAVHKLLSHLGVGGKKNAQVVDLASGTGKFTEILVTRPEEFEIVAVEPHEGMRVELVKKDLGSRIKVLEGDAGNIPLKAESVDALITAQAFHWFATEETLKEIHRVLRPGAAFGMIWNIEDYNSPKDWPATSSWEQKLNDMVFSLDDGQSRFRHLAWKKVFEDHASANSSPQFSLPIGEESVEWTVYLTDEAVWSRFSTLSQVVNLNENKRAELKKEIFKVLKEKGVEHNAAGEVAVHGRTYFAWTARV